jgi:hypothetical protein
VGESDLRTVRLQQLVEIRQTRFGHDSQLGMHVLFKMGTVYEGGTADLRRRSLAGLYRLARGAPRAYPEGQPQSFASRARAGQVDTWGVTFPARICDANAFEIPVAATMSISFTPARPGRISRRK